MSDLERLRLEYHEEKGAPNRDDWLPTAPPYIAALEAEVERLTRDRDEVYLLSTGCIYEGGGTEMVYTDLDLALAHIEEAAAGGQYGDPVEWPYVRDEECERLDWVVRAYLASGMDYLRLTRQVTNQVPGSLQFLRDRAALAAGKGET